MTRFINQEGKIMSKRFFIIVLSVVLAASLVGCGGKGTNNTSTNNTANQSEIDKIIAEDTDNVTRRAWKESNRRI